MGRPAKPLDTPELKKVEAAKNKWDRSQAKADKDKSAYEDTVVAALEDHGLRTLAKVAKVSTDAVRNIRIRHEKDLPA